MSMQPDAPSAFVPTEDNWKYRRRVLFLSLAWIGIAMTAILVRGIDNALFDQAFIALAGSAATLLTAYIFGAVWDDHNQRTAYGSYNNYQPSYQPSSYSPYRPQSNVEAPPAAEKPQPPPMS